LNTLKSKLSQTEVFATQEIRDLTKLVALSTVMMKAAEYFTKVVLDVLDPVYKENEGMVPHNAIMFENRTYVGYKCLSRDIQVTRKKSTKRNTNTLPRFRRNITDICIRGKFTFNSNSKIYIRVLQGR
jgi:hypothetical protein